MENTKKELIKEIEQKLMSGYTKGEDVKESMVNIHKEYPNATDEIEIACKNMLSGKIHVDDILEATRERHTNRQEKLDEKLTNDDNSNDECCCDCKPPEYAFVVQNESEKAIWRTASSKENIMEYMQQNKIIDSNVVVFKLDCNLEIELPVVETKY